MKKHIRRKITFPFVLDCLFQILQTYALAAFLIILCAGDKFIFLIRPTADFKNYLADSISLIIFSIFMGIARANNFSDVKERLITKSRTHNNQHS